jgi:acetolactate synthase-1/2/3 large subunit
VITGDGSFLMQGLEVHTAVELGLPILFVVFNNGRHGMCVTRQQLYFEGRVECSEYAPAAIATIARGMGSPEQLWCASASSRHELELRLAEYEAASPRRPGVLELRLGAEEMPPFAPFLEGTAPTETVCVPTASARTAA